MQKMPCIAVFLSIHVSSHAGISLYIGIFPCSRTAHGGSSAFHARGELLVAVGAVPDVGCVERCIYSVLCSCQWTTGPVVALFSMSTALPISVAGDAW
jgi:hypothetical protein